MYSTQNQPLINTPEVSVLMPVYNGEKHLSEAVSSILGQTFTNFEFLIINDGSSDKTKEILSSYNDPRIVLVDQENIGLTKSLNKSLSIARGKYVARMDCDDISLPKRLERQVAFMNRNPDIGVLGTGFQTIDSNGRKTGEPFFFSSEHFELIWDMHFFCPVVHPSVMIKKSVINKIGGYSEDITCAQDYDLWIRLSKVTKFANLQEMLFYLRKHSDNISVKKSAQQIETATLVCRNMIQSTSGKNVSMDIIRGLMNQNYENALCAISSGRLIGQLLQNFENSLHLKTSKETEYIRKNAAERIYNAIWPFIYNIHVWALFLLAFRLSPQVVSRKVSISLRDFCCKGIER